MKGCVWHGKRGRRQPRCFLSYNTGKRSKENAKEIKIGFASSASFQASHSFLGTISVNLGRDLFEESVEEVGDVVT